MWFSGRIMYASFSLLLGFSIIGCTGNRPVDLGLKDGYNAMMSGFHFFQNIGTSVKPLVYFLICNL